MGDKTIFKFGVHDHANGCATGGVNEDKTLYTSNHTTQDHQIQTAVQDYEISRDLKIALQIE